MRLFDKMMIDEAKYSFEPCKAEAPAQPKLCCAQAPANPLKRNKTMRYYDEMNDGYRETPPTDQERTQNYFLNRADQIGSEKYDSLQKTFGLRCDDRPQTFDEFVARINAGKFTFETYPKKKDSPYCMDYIEWKDPSVKADQKGFDAAWKTFESAKSSTRDAIMSSAPADAAAAIKALEAWVPTTSAS